MSNATRTPAEIDTELAELEYAAMKLAAPLFSLKARIAASWKRHQDLRYPGVTRARALETMKDLEAKLPEVTAKVTEALAPSRKAIDAINAEFTARGGWSRYFLVCNNGGHVHKTRSCSTCWATTEFAWLPGASGQDGKGLIDMFGSTVCTVCFPEAPIGSLKEAEKAAKKAAAKAEGYCDGHGKYALDPQFQYVSKWGTCPDCESRVSISSTGKVLKHKE